MKHSKIFKSRSGFRKKVEVDLWVDSFRGEFGYGVHVEVCDIGKRKFRPPADASEQASRGQIDQVQHELWCKVAPPKEA